LILQREAAGSAGYAAYNNVIDSARKYVLNFSADAYTYTAFAVANTVRAASDNNVKNNIHLAITVAASIAHARRVAAIIAPETILDFSCLDYGYELLMK